MNMKWLEVKNWLDEKEFLKPFDDEEELFSYDEEEAYVDNTKHLISLKKQKYMAAVNTNNSELSEDLINLLILWDFEVKDYCGYGAEKEGLNQPFSLYKRMEEGINFNSIYIGKGYISLEHEDINKDINKGIDKTVNEEIDNTDYLVIKWKGEIEFIESFNTLYKHIY